MMMVVTMTMVTMTMVGWQMLDRQRPGLCCTECYLREGCSFKVDRKGQESLQQSGRKDGWKKERGHR